ncbi:MAG TPA: TIM barrel protein [Vicinamibacterales bacterium]
MELTRRDALKTAGLTALAAGVPSLADAQLHQPPIAKPSKLRITQSVCQWCYQKMPLKEFFQGVVDTGLQYVDLLNEEQWTLAKDFGLTCSMGYVGAGSIPDGLNDPKNHEMLIDAFKTGIPKAKAAGVPNVICFFGNRRGMADADGIKNSIACLNQVKGIAEDHGVTICVELLNSKVDHKDYMGDHTAYGAEIIRAVDSPRVKLLYDIYHMQIMEGDVIRTIRTYQDAIGHYHTGGVPGRHELDATQELNWPAIVQAIIDTGFKGYFAHEFIPTRDPMTSLREAVALCDV